MFWTIIESRKKPELHPFSEKHIFGKIKGKGVKLTPHSPYPTRFMVE